MTKEYRAKIFKSGNSVALRLPAAMGLKPGTEMRLIEQDGDYRLEPITRTEDQRRIDLGAVWGKAPWLQPLKPEDRLFEERELDWEGKRLKPDG